MNHQQRERDSLRVVDYSTITSGFIVEVLVNEMMTLGIQWLIEQKVQTSIKLCQQQKDETYRN